MGLLCPIIETLARFTNEITKDSETSVVILTKTSLVRSVNAACSDGQEQLS